MESEIDMVFEFPPEDCEVSYENDLMRNFSIPIVWTFPDIEKDENYEQIDCDV